MARSTLALVILTIFVGGSNPWIVDPFTCGSKITAEFRELITDYHNSVRSKIAHGIERNHTGKLPSAKNMYEVAWDCELEKLAEKVAADEDFDVESIRPRAVNIDRRAHCESFELTYHRDIGKSLRRWEYEIRDFGQTSPENLYNDDSLEHFANMAYGKNTKIGCSYDRKGKALTFVCVYDLGAVWEEPIYELGPRCQKDSDCTTYENSKCDMLCVKK